MIKRELENKIKSDFYTGRAIVLLGARRVGKSTLINNILSELQDRTEISRPLFLNCDDPDTVNALHNIGLNELTKLINDHDIIFIDEAQKLPTIGNLAKLLVDYYHNQKQLIISGSSSINIIDRTTEPLTGRKFIHKLYPLSIREIWEANSRDRLKLSSQLNELLIYGSYPEVYSAPSFNNKARILDELTDSYLYKDILEFQAIRNPIHLRNLLKAIALQLGSQVSYSSLANLVGIDKNTVINYLDLLEKNYIIFRLPVFTKNKRREIGHSRKLYFWDVGVRNQLINDLRPLADRSDVGALWENFIVVERLKYLAYNSYAANSYFWRTYDGTEIDYVEEKPGQLNGFEIKYHNTLVKAPPSWKEYPKSTFKVITPSNFLSFLGID